VLWGVKAPRIIPLVTVVFADNAFGIKVVTSDGEPATFCEVATIGFKDANNFVVGASWRGHNG